MAYRNFDEYLIRLEQANLIAHVDPSTMIDAYSAGDGQPNDPTQVIWNTTAAMAPFSIVHNLFSTEQQIAWALGVESLSEIEHKLSRILDIDLSNGPATLMARASEFMGMLRSAGLFGKRTITGQPYSPLAADAQALFCKQLSSDGALAGLTGQLIYQLPDATQQNTTSAYLGTLADGTPAISVRGIQPGQGNISVAIIIGGDPATIWATYMPMPTNIDPLWMAGWLRRKQVPMTAATTHNLTIPADAELIIEGSINTDQPMYASATSINTHRNIDYALHITAITGTQNPIIPITTPCTHWMRKAEERLFLPIARTFLQDLHDVNFTHYQRSGMLAIASIKNATRTVPLMHGLWGTDQLEKADALITVDTTINVHNLRDVACAMMSNVNWHTDMIICRGGIDGSAVYGIDATQPYTTMHATGITHTDLSRPHTIWNDHLLITQINEGEDVHTLMHALWAKKPIYHLLITPAQADMGNIEDLFYDMLRQVNWQTDLIFSSDMQNRIAIDATS